MAAPVSAPATLGRFVWLELTTSDPDAAIEFYKPVVGWTTAAWEGPNPYTMWHAERGPVGGVMALTPDMTARHVPPNWIAYVSTPDADETLKQVASLGGHVIVPATDIPNVGRFGVFSDPQGAVLAVLAPQGENAPREGQPQNGEVCWYELGTSDATAAFDFYHALFGWEKTSSMEMGPGNIYQMYGRTGQTFGGMYKIDSKENRPPSWLYYIEIANVDDAAKQISKLGGKIVNGPMDVPGGRILMAADPQGAYIGLHTAKPQ
jgi:uncharacterized protein